MYAYLLMSIHVSYTAAECLPPCLNQGYCVQGKCICPPSFTGVDCGNTGDNARKCQVAIDSGFKQTERFSPPYFSGIKFVTAFKCIFEKTTMSKLSVNFGNDITRYM